MNPRSFRSLAAELLHCFIVEKQLNLRITVLSDPIPVSLCASDHVDPGCKVLWGHGKSSEVFAQSHEIFAYLSHQSLETFSLEAWPDQIVGRLRLDQNTIFNELDICDFGRHVEQTLLLGFFSWVDESHAQLLIFPEHNDDLSIAFEAFHEPLAFSAAGQNIFGSLLSFFLFFAVNLKIFVGENVYLFMFDQNVDYFMVFEYQRYVNFFDA